MTDLYRIKDLEGHIYDVADRAAREAVAALLAKIPAEASSSNQLADKEYVLDHIDSGGLDVPTGMLKGVSNNFAAAVPGTDYQGPLEAGTDYQTPLEAGTDYQTPLEAGTDYQTPLAEGNNGNYLSPTHVSDLIKTRMNRNAAVTAEAATPAGVKDWDTTEEAIVTVYMARGEAFALAAEEDTDPEINGQICWQVGGD